MNQRFVEYAAVVLFSLVICQMVGQAESKRQCDENGQCKFGGWCDQLSNTCRCNFKCSKDEWGYTWHCGPQQKNGRRMYFKNLCHLKAYACEHQENVEVVVMDFSKPRAEMCKPKGEPPVLCKRPQDFMGRCASFEGAMGNLDAGICLEDTASQKRCQCPSSKMGYNCETRIKVRSVVDPREEGLADENQLSLDDTSNDNVAQIAVFASVAFVAVVACIALFMKRHVTNRRQPLHEENHPIEFKATPHNLADARSDSNRQIFVTPPRERRLAERQISRDDVSLNLVHTTRRSSDLSVSTTNNNNNSSSHNSLVLLGKTSDDVSVNLADDVTSFNV